MYEIRKIKKSITIIIIVINIQVNNLFVAKFVIYNKKKFTVCKKNIYVKTVSFK